MRKTLLIVVFAGLAIFASLSLIQLFYLDQSQTQRSTQRLQVNKQNLGIEAQKINQRLPVRLKIPIINVDANIQNVGVNHMGLMDVPDNAIDVGWFKLGPVPGEKGSAVIAGHIDGKKGEVGVFNNLSKLKMGDKLYVEDGRGITTSFIVRESRTYNPGYVEEVFSLNDTAHLNLITCDGIWDGAIKSYSKRLVVFADIIQ